MLSAMGRTSALCALVVLAAWCVLLAEGCSYYEMRTRVAYRWTETCSWWGCDTYTVSYTQHYSQKVCCSGYVDYESICRRTVIGFEKDLYFLEDDDCTVQVCVKMVTTTVPVPDLFYVTRLTTNDSSELITLTPSVQRQCINVEVDAEELKMAQLSVINLPSFAFVNPSIAVIRPRQRVTIGFEQTLTTVFEDADNVTLCVRIFQSESLHEDRDFTLNLLTGTTSKDYVPVNETVTLSRSNPRHCQEVSIVHDYIHEPEELFTANINGHLPYYVTLNPGVSTVKVVNVQRELTIGFEVQEIETPESTGEISVCISGRQNISGAIVININIPLYASQDLSINDSRSHHLLFDDHHSRHCVNVTIVDDSYQEGDEIAMLTLETVSVSDHFYMQIYPSFLDIKILDDDATVVGFETHERDVTIDEKRGFTSIEVCITATRGDVFGTFFVLSQDGTAIAVDSITFYSNGASNNSDYVKLDGAINLTPFSPRGCLDVLLLHSGSSDSPTKTFTLKLRNPLKLPYLLEPSTLLIKICHSEENMTIPEVENTSSWIALPNSEMTVSKGTCWSEKSVMKILGDSKGHFCVPSEEEKMVRSFKLGISSPSDIPQVVRSNANCNLTSQSQILCGKLEPNSNVAAEECASTRPDVCGNRSVLFVLDTSRNVGEENFNLMTSAVSELAKHLCGDVQVAVVKFNHFTYLDLCFNCITNSRYNLSNYIKNNVLYKSSGDSGKDITRTTQCISESVFDEDCGSHRESDCIDIIFITDGEFNDTSSVCSRMTSLKHSLPQHDSICSKSRVYTIGIGSNVNSTALQCIADSEDQGHDTVFKFNSFEDFKKVVGKSVQYMYEKKLYCQAEETKDKRIDDSCY